MNYLYCMMMYGLANVKIVKYTDMQYTLMVNSKNK